MNFNYNRDGETPFTLAELLRQLVEFMLENETTPDKIYIFPEEFIEFVLVTNNVTNIQTFLGIPVSIDTTKPTTQLKRDTSIIRSHDKPKKEFKRPNDRK